MELKRVVVRKGFFTYPWDLQEDGPATVLKRMKQELGCDAIVLNACYHHARLLRPRARGPKTLELPGAVAAFQPQATYYPDPSLVPVPYPDLVGSNVIGRARQICSDEGLVCVLWVVGLHNSSLGDKSPQWCMQNCFGDRYHYALCPSVPEVRAYILALITDICDQFSPERVMLEAIGFLSLRHWVHHELFFSDWNETLEFLFSLCFCPACLDRAGQADIDALALRAKVCDLIQAYLSEAIAVSNDEHILGEIPNLLLAIPGMVEFLCARHEAVTRLIADAHEAAHARGVQLDAIPASFHRPSARAWLEGADIRRLAQVCDNLVPLPYFSDPAAIEADLQWLNSQVGSAGLSVGLSALPLAARDEGTLLALTQAAAAHHPEAIYFYNYGLMNARRLEWAGRAFTSI